MFHAKLHAPTSYTDPSSNRGAMPLAEFPLIRRQLQFLCSQPDAAQQLKELGARALVGVEASTNKLIDELTAVFVRLVHRFTSARAPRL